MHILLTTYGLILIFILFCVAQSRSTVNLALLDIVAKESFQNVRQEMLTAIEAKSKKYYEALRPEEKKEDKETAKEKKKQEAVDIPEMEEDDAGDTTSDGLDVDQTELPENKQRSRFLHVSALFNEKEPNIYEGRGKACFILLKNLINELYQGSEFYEAAKEYAPDIDEQLIQNLINKAKELQENEYHLPAIKVLCNLDLEDELQSYVRSKMFTGTKSRKKKHTNEHKGYYPVDEFLSLQKNPQIMSIWLAPKPLLMALFQDEKIVEDLMKTRHEMYNELRSEKASGGDKKSQKEIKGNELKRQFSTYIHGIDTNLIDFQVSSTRPVD